MSDYFNFWQGYYDKYKNLDKLKEAVQVGSITSQEFTEITGQDYAV